MASTNSLAKRCVVNARVPFKLYLLYTRRDHRRFQFQVLASYRPFLWYACLLFQMYLPPEICAQTLMPWCSKHPYLMKHCPFNDCGDIRSCFLLDRSWLDLPAFGVSKNYAPEFLQNLFKSAFRASGFEYRTDGCNSPFWALLWPSQNNLSSDAKLSSCCLISGLSDLNGPMSIKQKKGYIQWKNPTCSATGQMIGALPVA